MSARRLWREIAELGYTGGYTTLTDFLREVRPPAQTGFEHRFETPPGKQAQADFAHFKVAFEDEPEKIRAIWLFSIILAHSRWLWGRVHATTSRIVDEAHAEELEHLIPLAAIAYSAPLTVERRISRDGMVSVGGNLYSVPDTTRKRLVDVQNHPSQVRIFEDGALIAVHPVLEGKNQRRLDPSHRLLPPKTPPQSGHPPVARRPLDFYAAVGQRLANAGARP